jgi:hypothetical protein
MSIDTGILASQIEQGDFDHALGELSDAINKRKQVRKDAVLAQVQEVFGPNYTVTTTRNRDFIKGGSSRSPYSD